MTWTIFFLILAIFGALLFSVINGFHNAANAVATVVSTRVISPQQAVWGAAFFNFIAMFIFSPNVAYTISQIIKIKVDDPVFLIVILSGLIGGITWDLFTWWLGLPTSSSHALIGGLSGAGVAHAGWNALRWDVLKTTIEFIFLSPLIGLIVGFLLILACVWIFRNSRPSIIDKYFKYGQLVTAALFSIGHGANDAQKTMGVILGLLISVGLLAPEVKVSLLNPETSWIIVSCQLAISLGVGFGGLRIVKTMGMKLTKLKPVSGFCGQTAGAFTLFMTTYYGIPVSTTQTIVGSIIGAGLLTTRFSKINLAIATRILWAWLFTIPASALVAVGFYYLFKLIFGLNIFV